MLTDSWHLSASMAHAVGPGLVSARTALPAHFTIYFKDWDPNAARNGSIDDPRENLEFIIEGPSEPGPLTCCSNLEDGSVDVTYTPLLQGSYKINVKLFGEHITGSPFSIQVTGESIKAYQYRCKVNVNFLLERKNIIPVGKVSKVLIDVGDKKIGGGLSCAMAGPRGATVGLKLVEIDSPKYECTFSPSKPGSYFLHVKIAGENVPGSPFELRAPKATV